MHPLYTLSMYKTCMPWIHFSLKNMHAWVHCSLKNMHALYTLPMYKTCMPWIHYSLKTRMASVHCPCTKHASLVYTAVKTRMACLLYSTPSHVFIFTLINSRYLHHADISCSLSMTRLWFQSRWYYTKIITQEPWKMGKNRWAKVSFFGRRLGDIWQKYNCTV